ncbi:MAG: Verru_Chthon cassette protein A, partial [Prosthecobacter sp.]|nr:Verru_Chthon cassette protein A [Prosthecobacter sp.]
SGAPLYELDGSPEVGGFASFRQMANGRKVKKTGDMPSDINYEESVTGRVHTGLLNLDLVGGFIDVNRDDVLQFRGTSDITLKIYDHHVFANTRDEPVQIITVRLNEGRAPIPDLVTRGSYQVRYTAANGSTVYHPAIQAPRWWAFNTDGILGRDNGAVAGDSLSGRFYTWPDVSKLGLYINNPTSAVHLGAQRLPGAKSLLYTKSAGNFSDVQLLPHSTLTLNPLARIAYGPKSDGTGSWNEPWHYGTDTLRTLQPTTGDARLITAKKVVTPSDWSPHRLWNDEDEYLAHNFSSYNASNEPGFDRGTSVNSTTGDNTVRALPQKVTADPARSPDVPFTDVAARAVQKYYDFDDSDPGGRIGPFINKADEGNYSVGDIKFTDWTDKRRWRTTYFRADSGERYASATGSYFTPNRMVPSAVVMGSLPSYVWGNKSESGAWTNLLFRPYLSYPSQETGSAFNSASTHPGEESPPDHYLLDLFWMPVVEPYAISEPLSTAGKINLNYQIMPFTHIRRATGLHAAMKGELMAAMPNSDYDLSKSVKTSWRGTSGSTPPLFRSEASAGESKYWHHEIVVDRFKPESKLWWQQNINERVQGTLREFEERFNFGVGDSGGTLPAGFRGGLFRTTSQICEVHLIPSPVSGSSNDTNISASDVSNYSSRLDNLAKFWGQHCSTGDNTRERPYANLYQKFTTRSNTFRVHVRAQSIRKALRSVAANTFDPNLDTVSAEFRGSFLLERYIDQADLAAAKDEVNYAEASDPLSKKPLENYYRFRVIESKRFAP